jgi:xylulose-5-phosphate/fructose-6-phosphate phosphoketolase
MTVMNDMDRFHLVADVIDRALQPGTRTSFVMQVLGKKSIEHKHYIETYGEDMPEIRDWKWKGKPPPEKRN